MITISFFIMGTKDIIGNFIALKNKGAKIYDPFLTMLDCIKCVSFWLTLIMTGSFIIACQVSFVAYLLDKYILSKY